MKEAECLLADPRERSVNEARQFERGVVPGTHVSVAYGRVRGVGAAGTVRLLEAHAHAPRLVEQVVHGTRGRSESSGHLLRTLRVRSKILERGAAALPITPQLVQEAVVEDEYGVVGRLGCAHGPAHSAVKVIVQVDFEEVVPRRELGHVHSLCQGHRCAVGKHVVQVPG